MPNTTISPSMGMPIPVVSTDPGPDWANNINASLMIVDSHNHTPGQGEPVTPAGFNINTDLLFNDNNATLLRSTRYVAQGSPLALGTDIGCLYVSGLDLYFNDVSGNQVRITQSGTVTGSAGTITGLPSGTASAAFNAGAFTFQSATNTPALFNIGPVTIGANVANSKTVTLTPSLTQTGNYGLTFPDSAPAVNQLLVSDGSGNLSWTLGLLPLGGVVATFPNLSGAYSTSATTVADAYGFVKCNGQTISDATSPMNGASIPNINNSVFLMGSTTAGTAGGSNSLVIAHTHGAGSYATSVGVTGGTASLTGTTSFATTGHTHDMRHAHQWCWTGGSNSYVTGEVLSDGTYGTFTNGASTGTAFNASATQGGGTFDALYAYSQSAWFTSGALDHTYNVILNTGSPSATASVGISSTGASTTGSNSVTGTSSSTGTGSDSRPNYISAVYLMRVK